MKKITVMKKTKSLSAAVLACCILQTANCFSQGTAINSSGAAADNSALLDLSSTTQGFLMPRMTSGERNGIISPAEGLQIYNITTKCLEMFVSGAWNIVACPSACNPPAVPAANAAGGITCTTFVANWSSSNGANTYYLDVSTDAGFSGFEAGYNNLNVGNVTSASVTGLTTGATYYYRLRAATACVSSNSNTITVATATIPAAPVATAAANILPASFTANWNVSPGATSYYLDVATDNGFTGILSNYNNLDVGNVLTQSITSLSCATGYYYRVRASNACGTGQSSNIINPVTAACCCSWVAGGPWQYKIPVTVTNGGAAQTDFQVMITLNTQALVSGGKMRSDGSDIRITDEDKCTLLPYWIQEGTINTTATKIWTKIPGIPGGTKYIYVIYGNSGAAAAESGDNTFDFFDDFSGSTINSSKWTIAHGTPSLSGGGALTIKPDDAVAGKVNLSYPRILRFVYNGDKPNDYFYAMGFGGGWDDGWGRPDHGYLFWFEGGQNNFRAYANGNNSTGVSPTWVKGDYETLWLDPSTTNIFYNDVFKDAITSAYISDDIPVYIENNPYSGSTTTVDWIGVRKYASPSITTSNGSEESACQ